LGDQVEMAGLFSLDGRRACVFYAMYHSRN